MNIRFQDFTEQAQKVAGQVTLIASRHGQTVLDIEHITLALLESPDEELNKLYKELALDKENLRVKVEEIVSRLDQGSTHKANTNIGNLSIYPRVRKVIEQAQLEADRLSDKKVRPYHLFWAVVYIYTHSESRTAVGKIFKDLRVTPTKVHELILRGFET